MSSYWSEVVTVLAWTKQNTMQRAMRSVLEWPQSHATSKHYKYDHKINMNHNRSTAFERSVKKYWGGGGLNWFYGIPTSPSASVMVQNIQLFGPRECFLTHQWIFTGSNKSQTNTMMKLRWGLDRNNVLRPTPGDPWGVEQSFITDSVGLWKNIMLAWRNFCNKVYRNQTSMVT